MKIFNFKLIVSLMLFTISLTSCRKFVEIDPPQSALISETVFKEDVTANAAMISVYGSLNSNTSFASGGISSLTYRTGLSSDELQLYNTIVNDIQFSTNSLTPDALSGSSVIWQQLFKVIYQVNAILEGVSGSSSLSGTLKMELEGESKFVRAFAFFYLVNLFGDVPLCLTTDYRINAVMPRTNKNLVYQQIIKDLKDAQNLLLNDYSYSAGERVKPNKWVATALLARVYLYNDDWTNAEIEATKLINNTAMYELQPLNNVFTKNNKEAIWQLNNNASNTNDATTFMFSTRPTNGALYESFYNSFQVNDQRKANWILAKTSAGVTYYQPNKYKASTSIPVTNPVTQPVEYSMVMRLAEQYLIRAEARIQQNKIVEGVADLNVLRVRASLPSPNQLVTISANLSQEDALLTVEKERLFELFTEWGHRWLDLKRTNRADIILGSFKGANWQSTDQLYPIPSEQINNNPSMKDAQNPGYQ